MRRRKPEQRGFALLIIVLLVALLALTAATLLDLVGTDIQIASEHSKVVRAQMMADGAMREVIADNSTLQRLPEWDSCSGTAACPDFRYDYSGLVAGAYNKDPDNLFNRVLLDESNSAYAKFTGSPSEENYSAWVDLVKAVPVMDTGQDTAFAIVYEVTTDAQVSRGIQGGDASQTVSAEVYQIVTRKKGTLLPRKHRR